MNDITIVILAGGKSSRMGEHIQTMHIPISTKNIGIPSQFE